MCFFILTVGAWLLELGGLLFFHQFFDQCAACFGLHLNIAYGGFIGKTVKCLLFARQDLKDPLIDGVIRQQPMDQNIPGLTHSVGTGNSLIFNGGLELRLAKYNNTCTLNIKPRAA